MKVEVKCPGCDRPIAMRVQDLTGRVRCAKCWRPFVAVVDCEVPCPECGSVMTVPPKLNRSSVRCLACGCMMGESRVFHALKKAVLVAGACCWILIIFVAVCALAWWMWESLTVGV
jgi:hypothetical protein